MKKLFTLVITGMMLSSVAQHAPTNRNLSAGSLIRLHHAPNLNQISNQSLPPGHNALNFNTQRSNQFKNSLTLFQQMDSLKHEIYDAAGIQWINDSKNEFAYDPNGNNTSGIFSSWNGDAEIWETDGKQEFTYYNGILTEQVYYQWNPDTNIWEPAVKFTYNYDGSGNMTLSYTYSFDGSDWILATKDERTYDPYGNILTQITSMWNESGSEWLYLSKLENSYNGNGSLLVSTSSSWDFMSENWMNNYKDEYTYNGIGQQISNISYSWNTGTSQWDSDYKNEFSYDGNMNLVMVLEQDWNGVQWVNSYKTELAYNNTYTGSELILPWIFGEDAYLIMHMLTETTEYEYNGSAFMLSDRNTYYYSPVNITGIGENNISQAGIYPQPAKGQVTFTWATGNPTYQLGVYDINGRQILVKQIEKNSSVAVDQLAPGLYFYRLTGNNQPMLSGKLSVR